MSAEPHIHGGIVEGCGGLPALNDLVNAMSNAFTDKEDFERFGACLVLMKNYTPEQAGMLMVVLQAAYENAVETVANTAGGIRSSM